MRDAFIEMNIRFQNKAGGSRDRISPPGWLDPGRDSLSGIYQKQDLFFQQGVVMLGCVVQANTLLFRNNLHTCPACFIYTREDHYYREPSDLFLLANKLFELKGMSSLPHEIQYLADTLQDERGRKYALPLPLSFTGGREVTFTSLMVHRKHIPGHRLCNAYYPLIVLPGHQPDAMILPKWYWSKALLSGQNR